MEIPVSSSDAAVEDSNIEMLPSSRKKKAKKNQEKKHGPRAALPEQPSAEVLAGLKKKKLKRLHERIQKEQQRTDLYASLAQHQLSIVEHDQLRTTRDLGKGRRAARGGNESAKARFQKKQQDGTVDDDDSSDEEMGERQEEESEVVIPDPYAPQPLSREWKWLNVDALEDEDRRKKQRAAGEDDESAAAAAAASSTLNKESKGEEDVWKLHVTDSKAFFVPVSRTPEIEEQRRQLPIIGEEQEIMEAIRNNSLVIICGETGCGKSTQLPQFLFEGGFSHPNGVPGMIGITQPRRVAAVTTARRVAVEMNSRLGDTVGYQVRYEKALSKLTRIKYMTDGILLKEMQGDFLLRQYSVILIDEAHERNLNGDVLIGMLSRAVMLRAKMAHENEKDAPPPLRLVIMSATLRVEDFTSNRNLCPTPPPVIQVTTRQHPVVVHFNRATEEDYIATALKKVVKIHRTLPKGGILVFLSGKNEIRDLTWKLKTIFDRDEEKEAAKKRAEEEKQQQQQQQESSSSAGKDETEEQEEQEEDQVESKEPKKKSSKKGKKVEEDGEDDDGEDMKKKKKKNAGEKSSKLSKKKGKSSLIPEPEEQDAVAEDGHDDSDDDDDSNKKKKKKQVQKKGKSVSKKAEEDDANEASEKKQKKRKQPEEAVKPTVEPSPLLDDESNVEKTGAEAGESGFGGNDEAEDEEGKDGEDDDDWLGASAGAAAGKGVSAKKALKDAMRDDFELMAAEDEDTDVEEDETVLLQSNKRKNADGTVMEEDDEERQKEIARLDEEVEAMRRAKGKPIVLGSGMPTKAVILPLYSMMPAKEQLRVFSSFDTDTRLIVLATNVAETSITIPNVRYVVDCGKVKNKVFDRKTGISQFQIEWTSRASADQRAGRAGRTGPGHCYRLFSSAVFANQFEQFAPPEILTSPLESVVLQMAAMHIPSLLEFPFPTPPPRADLESAQTRLKMIGALDPHGGCTTLGVSLAHLPLEPERGKMVLLGAQGGVEQQHNNNKDDESKVQGSLNSSLLGYVVVMVCALGVETLLNDENMAALQASEGEKEKKKKNTKGMWQHPQSDVLGLVKAVGAYMFSTNKEQFAANFGLSLKHMKECVDSVHQVARILSMHFPESTGLTPEFFKSLRPPTPAQEILLRQILLAGYPHQIARRTIVPGLPPHMIPYISTAFEEVALLYPTSGLHTDPPAYLIHVDSVRSTAGKLYLKRCSSIAPEWIAKICPSLCQGLSSPLDDPPPAYDATKDAVLCTVLPTVGVAGRGWELPLMQVEYPEGGMKTRWFARLLLEGKICSALAAFRGHLNDSPTMMLRPALPPKAAALLFALSSRKISKYADLEQVWSSGSPGFLLSELSQWIQGPQVPALSSIWPPKNRREGGGAAAAAATALRISLKEAKTKEREEEKKQKEAEKYRQMEDSSEDSDF